MFKKLISWSLEQYAYLPWRKERSLYRTLVSEIMLQQTTVGTVLNHFEKFIKTYPDLSSLANASEEEILISWKGLGYYRRAKNLRHIAIEITDSFNGKIPLKEDELLSLKGIGKYTANALMAMGNNKRALAVDANLERILARFYGYQEVKGPKLQLKILEDFAQRKILEEMNKCSPREFNEALMDLGRVLCQKKKTWCHLCPLSLSCVAYREREPLAYPREEKPNGKTTYELDLLRVIVKEKNKVLFYQKAESEWLSGQWELPTFILRSEDKKLKQYPQLKQKIKTTKLTALKSTITKYKIINYILELSENDFLNMTSHLDDRYIFKKFDPKLNAGSVMIKILNQGLIKI
jgi:A/G-specific adenine glycosylase